MIELLSGSIFSKIPYLPQILSRSGWSASFALDGGVPKLENIVVPGQGPMPLMDVTAALGKSAVTWTDLRWVWESWKGPIIIKGALIADHARRAVDEGTSAIVVSNHGARQLDCVLPTIRALPEIVAAIGGKSEILMDGGIRRGSDIVKALCLGARAVLIGRANAYGLCGWAGGRRTRNQDFARRC
jgi:isopentenyl diphosphate isomerase/L-lactate dehydrogenase-like FMN-dependent dehydrogenase